MIVNPTAFAQNGRVSLPLPALNPGAGFSSLLINVLLGFFFFAPQNRAVLTTLKTRSGRYPFFSMIFFAGNSFAASWLAEAASPVTLTC